MYSYCRTLQPHTQNVLGAIMASDKILGQQWASELLQVLREYNNTTHHRTIDTTPKHAITIP